MDFDRYKAIMKERQIVFIQMEPTHMDRLRKFFFSHGISKDLFHFSPNAGEVIVRIK
jgi:hypothetical protein